MKPTKPILFLHCVDDRNINAQSSNTKAILAHWDSAEFPAEVLHFHDPDPAVASNPHVRLHRMPRNRLWKAYALKLAARQYSAVVYPGLAPVFDDTFRRLRRAVGRGGSVISTVEGLTADSSQVEQTEAELSAFAGHRVYCQPVLPMNMAALSRVKRNSDLIIAISPFLKQMAGHIWPGPRLDQLPLGVDFDIFHAHGRTHHGSRLRPWIVSAGNCSPHKRPALFYNLARTYPGADFTWFGEGTQRAELQDRAKSDDLKNIDFAGAVDRKTLADMFRQADVFTLPSAAEGVPKVTQEAAACGLPVVCMEYYEPFSVQNGLNGFQASDDASYAGVIAMLISDAELRAKMGAASAKMALDWGWNDLAMRWQDTICSAVRGRAWAGSIV